MVFLASFLFKEFLAILSVFPLLPKDLGVGQAEEILAFLEVFLAVFQKGKEKKIRVVLRPLRAIASNELFHYLLRQQTTIAVTPLAESTPSPHSQSKKMGELGLQFSNRNGLRPVAILSLWP